MMVDLTDKETATLIAALMTFDAYRLKFGNEYVQGLVGRFGLGDVYKNTTDLQGIAEKLGFDFAAAMIKAKGVQ